MTEKPAKDPRDMTHSERVKERLEREHYEKMRKAALSRKKVAVKAGVSFAYEGIPLVCFSPVKVEV